MKRNIRAYLRGEVDAVQLLEPLADALVSARQGHVWHRFSDRGDICYTTFYATRRVTTTRRDDCHRLVAGIARAQTALFRSTPATIAQVVAPFLPDVPREALARIITAYRANGLWSRVPDLPPSPFVRLKAAMVSGGLIGGDPPWTRLVDAELSTIN